MRKTGFIRARLISSLVKIYDSDTMPEEELGRLSLLKNERKSFQLAIESDSVTECTLTVRSDLKGIRLYRVEDIKSDFPMWKKGADSFYRFSESGYYPDLLVPSGESILLRKGISVLWVELEGKDNEVGSHRIELSLEGVTLSADVEIIDAELSFGSFVYTNWLHTDCLMSYYDFEAFSEEYWRVTENFLRTAREHGMNCVLTPLFTPPLDTEKGRERPTVQLVDVAVREGKYSFGFRKLDRWIETAQRCGIEYFELSHFYTQWGAKHAPKIMAHTDKGYERIFGWETRAASGQYKSFLEAFSLELKKYLEKKGIRERVFIHVSDEPNFGMLFSYGKASRHIHRLFESYKITDALSDYWLYRLKLVSNPIPSTDHIEKFLGKREALWTYYCSAQKNHCVSNRFFCNSSLRTRVLGYQLYKFRISGFLHWGYNFYYTQLSKKAINPFEVSDAGGAFPSGDSYVVYPSREGTAYASIRLKVFYDALQDMAALNTLERLTDRQRVMDIIEENGRHSLTFTDYPHEDEWLLRTREKINSEISSAIRADKGKDEKNV